MSEDDRSDTEHVEQLRSLLITHPIQLGTHTSQGVDT